jgi:hypothetical protein
MTLCPVAMTAGCRRCPVFSLCPLKSVIGDQPGNANDAASEDQPKPDQPKRKK